KNDCEGTFSALHGRSKGHRVGIMNKRTEKRWTLEMVCAGALLVAACGSNDSQDTGAPNIIYPTVGGQPGFIGAGGASAGRPAAPGSAPVIAPPAAGGQPQVLAAGGAAPIGVGGQAIGGSGGALGTGGTAGQGGVAGGGGQAMGTGGAWFVQTGPDIVYNMKG